MPSDDDDNDDDYDDDVDDDFLVEGMVMWRAVIVARQDAPHETKRVIRWVPKYWMRKLMEVATRNWPKNICMHSREMAFPVVWLSSGQGLDRRIPISYRAVDTGYYKDFHKPVKIFKNMASR